MKGRCCRSQRHRLAGRQEPRMVNGIWRDPFVPRWGYIYYLAEDGSTRERRSALPGMRLLFESAREQAVQRTPALVGETRHHLREEDGTKESPAADISAEPSIIKTAAPVAPPTTTTPPAQPRSAAPAVGDEAAILKTEDPVLKAETDLLKARQHEGKD